MSADNAIYYREIDGAWYVMHGFASNEYSDADFIKRGRRFESKRDCLTAAAELYEEVGWTEYGIVNHRYTKG